MTVDAQWAQRNLGMDPRDASPPDAKAATATEDGAAVQRELIDFDSESQDLPAFAKAASWLGLDRTVALRRRPVAGGPGADSRTPAKGSRAPSRGRSDRHLDR